MKSYGRVWLYQCPNSECGCLGFGSEAVIERECKDGVQCPKCLQKGMVRVREAVAGEYDEEAMELQAQGDFVRMTFKKLSPSEIGYYMARQAGVPYRDSTVPNSVGTQPSKDLRGEDGKGETSEKLLTEQEVAGILGVSGLTIRRLVRERKIGFIQLNKRKKVFTQTHIDDFIRRESGLVGGMPSGKSLFSGPNRNEMSLEKSRELLRGRLQKR